mmetsp:Transcript_26289/g.52687  ORF Transcript_26289/g.52687 Transcript_26289/m.52687 type:complete len:104 (-) Transcript_26289:42-353(-)|eukprot:CAMPEP_0196739936 /NCGR_PEP_ID=MMETSP1091-20130531/27090_1 /TAXON_ID=302021 /ORGANISM="Rhodomonas sp., Strain CCMP768" /LENGTH=103 /DNA_ID=CAMNT_0042084779 /DNA_START=108 /DNA_END=419 /DNA_ORIENTATION=+
MEDTTLETSGSSALPATKTAGGMRITQKKKGRASDQAPAVMPNDKLADEVPQMEESAVATNLPAAREHTRALQQMAHGREPTIQKMPKNERAMGRIMQPRPGF